MRQDGRCLQSLRHTGAANCSAPALSVKYHPLLVGVGYHAGVLVAKKLDPEYNGRACIRRVRGRSGARFRRATMLFPSARRASSLRGALGPDETWLRGGVVCREGELSSRRIGAC